jgi:hypothetical protein
MITYRILVRKPERRRPLGRHRPRWEDNIKIDLKEVGWGVDLIHVPKYRNQWQALVNMVMNLQIL